LTYYDCYPPILKNTTCVYTGYTNYGDSYLFQFEGMEGKLHNGNKIKYTNDKNCFWLDKDEIKKSLMRTNQKTIFGIDDINNNLGDNHENNEKK